MGKHCLQKGGEGKRRLGRSRNFSFSRRPSPVSQGSLRFPFPLYLNMEVPQKSSGISVLPISVLGIFTFTSTVISTISALRWKNRSPLGPNLVCDDTLVLVCLRLNSLGVALSTYHSAVRL